MGDRQVCKLVSSFNMANDDLAFQYLIVAVGFPLFLYVLSEYVLNWTEYLGMVKTIALKLVPSAPNPLVHARVMMVVPHCSSLSIRVAKRFWLKHGFKLLFLFVFLMYTMNVWGSAVSEDPFVIVGVPTSATNKEVRRACRQGSLKLHPDKHPGKEEEIRPAFERHTRACKLLSDKKAREKYVKYGTPPRRDKEGEQGSAGVSMNVSVSGAIGGGFTSILVYFLVLVGLPSMIASNFGHHFQDEDAQLAGVISTCKALNADLISLYTYDHLNSLFLDLAELYINVATAEFTEAKAHAKDLNPRRAGALDSLAQSHSQRTALWLDSVAKDDSKCTKLDAKIKEQTDAIDNLKKKSGSGRY